MKTFCKIIFLFFFVYSINCLNKQKDCKCKINPQSKIVGGKQAHHLAYPWIVSISTKPDNIFGFFKKLINDEAKKEFHSCGGSIINEYWILTAAHCLPENERSPLYVGYGNDNDLAKIFDFGRVKSIRTIKYPKFGMIEGQTLYDIGLIELEKPIQFTENVKPACFSNKNENLYSGILEHAGWGATNVIKIDIDNEVSSDPKIPRNLKEMFLVDESDSHPNCYYNDKVICAKGMVENESSCKGDSGGPVHHTKNGKSNVVGITSYSSDIKYKNGLHHLCVGSTVYTRVSSYINWIKYHVDDDICDY